VQVGSLVKNKNTQSVGLVVKMDWDNGDTHIYFPTMDRVEIWSINSKYLEVICE